MYLLSDEYKGDVRAGGRQSIWSRKLRGWEVGQSSILGRWRRGKGPGWLFWGGFTWL